MAGIYLHIPFCKQACHYCNFHFSTSLRHRESMTPAILREMEMSAGYLQGQKVETIYFGGGTPSLLPVGEIKRMIERVYDLFEVGDQPEITLETNPDDMSLEWLAQLRGETPVNRLSIGIQSFQEADLQWMNRAHTAQHARTCLENALTAGFDNLTIDLIYGAPSTSDEDWVANLEVAYQYRIPHLSCYALTVEEGTALNTFIRKGKMPPVDEERSARQFEYLMASSEARGYQQYEISNFSLPGRHAVHNSNYWLGSHYLGLGPSAHSFNGKTRQWNIANNAEYIRGVESGDLRTEIEVLTPENRFNEYVMTMLRTHWGCAGDALQDLHPKGAAQFAEKAKKYLESGEMKLHENLFILTKKGRLLADGIAMDLFVV